MLARNIEIIDDMNALEDTEYLDSAHENIKMGDIYVVRNMLPSDKLRKIHEYLADIGRSSLPNYEPIALGSPNSHRLNRWDPRSYVKGCFHQFTFYPWNDDVFDLFRLARPVYELKNRLSGISPDRFLGKEPDDGCIARIAVQFYPAGGGALNTHVDPVDYHQLTVPTTLLGAKGDLFEQGGAYVNRTGGDTLYIDDLTSPGDIVFFNASVEHGVAPVDPDQEMDWLSFKGRWMMLFSVNKLQSNERIGDAAEVSDDP